MIPLDPTTYFSVDAITVDCLRVAGALFAVNVAGEYRYPHWQFTGDASHPLLPGLPELVAAIPKDWGLEGALAFMSTPKNSARIAGEPVTPITWLRHRGDPNTLVRILESFLQT